MRARLRTPVQEVWQLPVYFAAIAAMPDWVKSCTIWRDGELYVVRRSGKQLVERGDWLIRDGDEPSWTTDDDFQQQYEVVV